MDDRQTLRMTDRLHKFFLPTQVSTCGSHKRGRSLQGVLPVLWVTDLACVHAMAVLSIKQLPGLEIFSRPLKDPLQLVTVICPSW